MLSTNSTISTNTSRIMPSNNSSLPISSQVTTTTTTTILMTTSYLFENANIINMFGGVFLTLIGCMGNILALLILVYSRNRQPRISGVNYLILLTITNTVFLALHFYMSTYNRIVYFFGLDYQSSLLFLDSSTLLCKTLSYMKYSARSLNTMLTVCFCLERLLAVYYPLQMRALDGKCSIIFRVGIIVSFILPSYSLFLTELVANTDTVRVRSSFNLTASFNFYSLTPSFGQFTCSANSENFKALIKFHFVMFLIIFISYVFASLSILAIVVRVKRSKSFIVAFRAKSNSTTYRSSIAGVGGGGGGMDESMIMIEKGGGGESSSRGVRLLQRNQSSSSSRSFSFKLWPRSSVSLVNSSTRSLSQSRAHKIHDTKILSSISLSFVLLNTPYFIVMFAMFIHANRMTTTSVTNSVDGIVVDLHREEYSEVELVNKMKIQGYIILTETLQLVNFSLTGLLFFCSGQIFRMHALKCLQRALPFL